MFKTKNAFAAFSLFLFITVAAAVLPVCGQTMDFERARHQDILRTIKSDIKRYYYDQNFHGIDLDARFKTADERVKNAKSVGEMEGVIAQVLVDFNDSHLFYNPPGKAAEIEYGWHIQMIGDKCYIVAVDEKSDAEAKGVKPGDEVYALDGFEPTRDNLWKMNYYYYLRPRGGVKMELVKPDGKHVEVEMKTKIKEGKRVRSFDHDSAYLIKENEDAYIESRKQYFYDKIDGLLVWKMPGFSISPPEIDDLIGKIKKRQALILDLRNNGGGRVDMLQRLIGYLFPEDVKVDDKKSRKDTKPEIAETRGKNAYTGKIVVLVDSNSASASEIFARVMQLEKRAIVLGDRSAGAVMESIHYSHESGTDIVAAYGASITVGDLIMKDGKSLEKIGVIPDEKILPTALDLANKRDPVIARAAEILGFKLSPEDAGKLFPDEAKK